MIKQEISKRLKIALSEFTPDQFEPVLDYPAESKFGDYTTNVAMQAFKLIPLEQRDSYTRTLHVRAKNPKEFAEKMAIVLKENNKDLFKDVQAAGPGFLNFWINDDVLATYKIEHSQLGKGKKVIVEYSSPNIAKPFTIGHLRSTIIGDAVASLLEAIGYEVFRDNHVGDWGTQFGKQICAIKKWGNEEQIENAERPVKELVALYVKFHEEAEKNAELEDEAREWFKKLEDGDPEARALWQKCIDWSWKEFDKIYNELGVTFTENNGRGYGEAFFEDKMQPILDELKEKHLLEEGKEGAMIVNFPDETKLPPVMILKKDGATLYSTRDLATDKFRLEKYGKDVTIINEVGMEQSLYFQQLYKLEEMLGWIKSNQRVHIKHGLYRFKEGKMSTRKGNVIWLEDVLKEARKGAFSLTNSQGKLQDEVLASKHPEGVKKQFGWENASSREEVGDKQNDLAKIVGIGSLKWNDLKRDSKQDINFDWDEILNMQGNSGPYMQYVYVRTRSVLEKAGGNKKAFDFAQAKIALTPEERELLRLLARFPEIVEEAAIRYAPHLLATYLFDLAQAFNLFYQKSPILKAEEDVRDFRLYLTEKSGEVIKQGLALLGIQVPQKM